MRWCMNFTVSLAPIRDACRSRRSCSPPRSRRDFSSRPAKVGRGDRALARWEGRGRRHSFCIDNEAPPQTPPPPRFAWSPSPAIAEADKRSRSRDAHASESCHAISTNGSPRRGGGAPTGAPSIGRTVGCGSGADRSPLASRRSTAALARQLNATAQPRPRFTRARGRRCYPRRHSRLSEAPRAPVVMPAGSMPGPPGSGVTSPARRNRTRPIARLSPVDALRWARFVGL